MSEQVSFARPRGLEGIEVLTASNSTRCWSMIHETYTIGLVTAGRGRWRCRGEVRPLHAGQVMLIEPGDVHATQAVDEPGSFTAFFAAPEAMQALVRTDAAGTGALHFRDIATDDARVAGALESLSRMVASPAADPFGLSQLAAVAFRALFERHAAAAVSPRPASPRIVRRAAERIRAAFDSDPAATDLRVGELASELGATASGLIHGFNRTMGLPPYQYLLRLRLEKARRMIEGGPAPGRGLRNLADVAAAAGFYDLSHLGRAFRRVMGVSPSGYARQIGVRWRSGHRG